MNSGTNCCALQTDIMTKRLRSPENIFHCRQEKKFITSKDLDVLSGVKMKQIYDKTRQILFNGANQGILSELKSNSGNHINGDSTHCCSQQRVGFAVADANGNSEIFVAACSFCDTKVCNYCGSNCSKCYKLFCSHCSIPDYSCTNTVYICHTCYC